jgi:hypothetical protein
VSGRDDRAPSRLACRASWARALWAVLVAGSVAVYVVLNWAAVAAPWRALWRAGGQG